MTSPHTNYTHEAQEVKRRQETLSATYAVQAEPNAPLSSGHITLRSSGGHLLQLVKPERIRGVAVDIDGESLEVLYQHANTGQYEVYQCTMAYGALTALRDAGVPEMFAEDIENLLQCQHRHRGALGRRLG